MTTDEANVGFEGGYVPQFGLIDLVDAFTAFRHEYRSQVKESRLANESLQLLLRHFEQLSQSRTDKRTVPADRQSADDSGDKLRTLLIDFDIQWSRAIEAVARVADVREKEHQQGILFFEETIAAMPAWRRWVAAPAILACRKVMGDTLPKSSGVTEGLTILLSRLRQLMDDQRIERIEVLGKPFDGEIMRSIGTQKDSTVAVGFVAQQLSPAYRYGGEVIRFADVRVAVEA